MAGAFGEDPARLAADLLEILPRGEQELQRVVVNRLGEVPAATLLCRHGLGEQRAAAVGDSAEGLAATYAMLLARSSPSAQART